MKGSSYFVLLLFVLEVAWVRSHARGLLSLSGGSSLSVDKENDFLISPNGSFSSGFYKVGTNAYCYSIWFTNSLNKTVVWMANRDKPVNGKQSKLTLYKNGNLILTDADGFIVWSTETFSQATVELEARLLETGNLILINLANEIIWESFGSPTDTLLPTQPIVKNTTLVSMRNRGTYLSGFYNFKFDDVNVLHLIYNGPLVSSVYWPNPAQTIFFNGRTPYDSSRVGSLNELGRFTSSDNFTMDASDYGVGPKRRLTLDYDGMLRLYSLDESSGLWEISWIPHLGSCRVHGLCGPNGICLYDPLPTCSCPHGFDRNDPSDWSKGCSPRFNLTCNPFELDFITFWHADYYGYDLSFGGRMTLEECRTECLKNCQCIGFGYALNGGGNCYQKNALLNGNRMPFFQGTIHIKVPQEMAIPQAEQWQLKGNHLNCSATKIVPGDDRTGKEDNNKIWYLKYLIACVGSTAIIEMLFVGLGWWYVFRKHPHEESIRMGYMVLAAGFKPFSFAELKAATQNFKVQIGKGGFGTVYRGILDDNRAVAVKRLEGILQGEAEFWAEVSIIGKLNHKNLAKMRGFCAQGKHKLLVYDFIENGSLDILLFSKSSRALGFDQRYNIALGTASGLAYIHEECLEWVLHCDVKPQNILLDDDLEPKVTDFGMSKLFGDNDNSGFSRVRGTRGYVAPEWMMNLKIDAKADVYSYGIVLLELVSGKSASGFHLEEAQENEFNHLVQWVGQRIEQEGLEGVVDPRLNHEFDYEKLERLVRVALRCVAEDRDMRPAMSKVVELLTGIGESNPNSSEGINN